MILKGFWTCFEEFWFSRSPNPLHDPCIRYGAKKIEKFFFVSYALKMILNGFWTCFDDFWFSRSANPLHDSMCKVWDEKKSKIYFCFLWCKNDFKRVLDVFWGLLVFEVAKSVTCPMYKVWAKKIENFFFDSYALKMILKGFWMCFVDFWFSRSPNPLHVPCIRYGWNWS